MVVKAKPQRLYPGRRNPVPLVQEREWVSRSVWMCTKSLALTRVRTPDRPVRGEPLTDCAYVQQVTYVH